MPILKKVNRFWFTVHKKTINYKPSTVNWRQRRHGFTLIELLVVISIIGILASIGTVAYSNAQAKSRDSRRKQDMQQIKKALVLYYSDNQRYPGGTTPTCQGNTQSGSWSWGTTAECDLDTTLEPTYIKKVPIDPVNSATPPQYYGYTNNMWCGPGTCTLGNQNRAVLWTYVENTKDPDRGDAGLFGYGDLATRKEYMIIVNP